MTQITQVDAQAAPPQAPLSTLKSTLSLDRFNSTITEYSKDKPKTKEGAISCFSCLCVFFYKFINVIAGFFKMIFCLNPAQSPLKVTTIKDLKAKIGFNSRVKIGEAVRFEGRYDKQDHSVILNIYNERAHKNNRNVAEIIQDETVVDSSMSHLKFISDLVKSLDEKKVKKVMYTLNNKQMEKARTWAQFGFTPRSSKWLSLDNDGSYPIKKFKKAFTLFIDNLEKEKKSIDKIKNSINKDIRVANYQTKEKILCQIYCDICDLENKKKNYGNLSKISTFWKQAHARLNQFKIQEKLVIQAALYVHDFDKLVENRFKMVRMIGNLTRREAQ